MNIRLIDYLPDEKDRLIFRSVCTDWREHARESEPAPYKNKVSFIIGISGQFNHRIQSSLTDAWNVYECTIDAARKKSSTKKKSAAIYKRSEFNIHNKLKQYAHHNGTIYDPPKNGHTWKLNEIWVLAQIHIGRSFTIVSPLLPMYKMREKHRKKYSAFAREMATAVTAGYQPIIKNDELVLRAPTNITKRNIHLRAIKTKGTNVDLTYQALADFSVMLLPPKKLEEFCFYSPLIDYLNSRDDGIELLNQYFFRENIFNKFFPDISSIMDAVNRTNPALAGAILELAKKYFPLFLSSFKTHIDEMPLREFKKQFPDYPALLKYLKKLLPLHNCLLNYICDNSLFHYFIDNHIQLIYIAEFAPDQIEKIIDYMMGHDNVLARVIPNAYALLSICEALPADLKEKLSDHVLSNPVNSPHLIRKTLDVTRLAMEFPNHATNLLKYVFHHPYAKNLIKDEQDLTDMLACYPEFTREINYFYCFSTGNYPASTQPLFKPVLPLLMNTVRSGVQNPEKTTKLKLSNPVSD